MTWEEFRELFMGKYFPTSARHVKAREFLKLKHGMMTVLEYVAKFIELARFADDYVATDMAKVRKFEDGKIFSIRGKIIGLLLQEIDLMVKTTIAIERKVKDLGLEVETFEEPLHVSSPLRTRVNVDHICQDCELEISGILLIVDLRVMDMSEFDVILGMDWLMVHRVVIDCDCRRITANTQDDVCVMF